METRCGLCRFARGVPHAPAKRSVRGNGNCGSRNVERPQFRPARTKRSLGCQKGRPDPHRDAPNPNHQTSKLYTCLSVVFPANLMPMRKLFGWGIKVITPIVPKRELRLQHGLWGAKPVETFRDRDQDHPATLALAWCSNPNGGGGRTSNGDVNLHCNTRECVPHRRSCGCIATAAGLPCHTGCGVLLPPAAVVLAVAAFTGFHGGQTWKSTGLTDHDPALVLVLAKRWEAEARAQRSKLGRPARRQLYEFAVTHLTLPSRGCSLKRRSLNS